MKKPKQQIFFSKAAAGLCLRIITPAVGCLALSCSSSSPPSEQTAPSEQSSASVASFVRVRLPEGVSRADLKSPSVAVRKKLDAALAQHLLSARAQAAGDVVVYEDANGLVLPDAEAAAILGTADVLTSDAGSNDITFTYDSPDYPWPADQLSSVQGWLNTCYPIIKEVYGPPAFAHPVNVRNNPNLTLDGTPNGSPVAGEYNPTLNEFQIRTINGPVLCHELIHAFRDDYGIGLSSWEEGMTRAVEIEVLKRAGIPEGDDSRHSNNIFHDQLNQPCVGVLGSTLAGAGWGQGPMRYNLAAYAWAKPMLEDFSFYPRFNASYYAQRANNWSVAYDEVALVGIAAQTKPLVEDQPFSNWIAGQYVLGSSPPVGDFVYIRSLGNSGSTVYLFHRDVNGTESVWSNVNVSWTIADSNGTSLASGSGLTNDHGVLQLGIASYTGSAKITATATPASTPITSTAYTTYGPQEGIFGVVPGHLTGSVTLTAVDQGSSQVTVPVVNGVFSSPTLTPVSGRIRYSYTNDNGVSTATATRTKDISPYFVQIDAPVGLPATPTNVAATAGNAQVQLSWSASSGAASYVVLGTTTSGSGYSTVATGITTTSYTVTGLTNGTTYYYLVLAQGVGGNSAPSREVSAKPAVTVPATPANFTATASNSQVQLSWSASSGATSYVILGSTTSGSGYSTIATGITTTSHTIMGLTNGITYYYLVLAQGPGGNSAPSREASARPSSTPCSNPTVVPSGTSQVTLNTTAGVCYKVSQTIHGWGCSNFAGRTISVNGGTPSSTCGFAVSAWSDGAYYLNASAGTYSYATVYWW